ncbi:MAG: hypothetical protein ACSHXW_19390, partial [Yoonia sp.]
MFKIALRVLNSARTPCVSSKVVFREGSQHDYAPPFDGVVVIQQMIKSHRISTSAAVRVLEPLLHRRRSGEVPLQGAVILSPPASKQGISANLLV